MEVGGEVDDTIDVLKALAVEWSRNYACGVNEANVIEAEAYFDPLRLV